MKWLGTTARLELVEDTTWGDESDRVRGKVGMEWLQEKVSFLKGGVEK